MYAVRTPLWQAPDEPAHYNYVRDLALGQGLPILTPEDWNAESGRLIRAGFPEGSSVDGFGYEAHQPPTYYAILAPAEMLLAGRPARVQVHTLRLLGALLMLPVIALAWQVGRRVLPNRRWLALGAAGFVALLPQAVAMNASINNDVLGILAATSLLLWAVWTYQRGEARPSRDEGDRSRPWDRTVVVGALLVGFVLLSKTTAYSSLILVPVTLFLVGRRQRLGIVWVSRTAVIILVAGVLIASPWFTRNMIEYGAIDPLGQIRHDEIVVGQAAGRLDSVEGWLETITVSFRSFFIQLGWMSVPAQDRVYWMLLVLACVAVAGTVTSIARAPRLTEGRGRHSGGRRHGRGWRAHLLQLPFFSTSRPLPVSGAGSHRHRRDRGNGRLASEALAICRAGCLVVCIGLRQYHCQYRDDSVPATITRCLILWRRPRAASCVNLKSSPWSACPTIRCGRRFGVASYMQRNGFRIIPVNPRLASRLVLGEPAYPDLGSIPGAIDVVDVFPSRGVDRFGHRRGDSSGGGRRLVTARHCESGRRRAGLRRRGCSPSTISAWRSSTHALALSASEARRAPPPACIRVRGSRSGRAPRP